jgi:hypothetical protein
LLKSKGRDAVVDEQGYVKVPIGEEQDQKEQQQRRQRKASSASASSSTTSSSRVPEGQSDRPAVSGPLPIVRPNDEDKGTFFSGLSWKQLGASTDVIAALQKLGIKKPSHVQVCSSKTRAHR